MKIFLSNKYKQKYYLLFDDENIIKPMCPQYYIRVPLDFGQEGSPVLPIARQDVASYRL